ncbi:MAG: hypothetical protein HYU66_21430 [Armatimonadetes bacterium]|nr:hypothetical protein [Armatimonadota bacterium]
MSRPYRIVVQKVVESEVTAEDRSTLRLQVDPVLGEGETDALLEGVLARRGWERAGDGVWRKERGEGETMTLDVAKREVTTTLELRRKVEQQVRRELRGDTWNWRQMREMTAQELAEVRRQEEERLTAEVSGRQVARAEEELQSEVGRRLAEGAPERRQEVNRIVVETVAEALRQKARELGNVDRVDEAWDGDEYELTISIRE